MGKNEPLITTVIPTYRRVQDLKKAIQSALDQTIKGQLIHVFDNHSEDGTKELVQSFQKSFPNVLYFCHEKTLKAPENFKLAIDSVKTPYLSILADDDYLFPHFYETALESLQKHKKASFFVGGTLDVDANGKRIANETVHWPDQEFFSALEGGFWIIQHYINWTGSLFTREMFQKEPLNLKVRALDYDFMIRASFREPFTFSKTSVAAFVHHKKGYSNFSGLKLFWPGYLYTLNSLKLHLDAADYFRAKSLLEKKIDSALLGIACRALSSQNVKEVKKIYLASRIRFFSHRKIGILYFYGKIAEKCPIFFFIFVQLYSWVKGRR